MLHRLSTEDRLYRLPLRWEFDFFYHELKNKLCTAQQNPLCHTRQIVHGTTESIVPHKANCAQHNRIHCATQGKLCTAQQNPLCHTRQIVHSATESTVSHKANCAQHNRIQCATQGKFDRLVSLLRGTREKRVETSSSKYSCTKDRKPNNKIV